MSKYPQIEVELTADSLNIRRLKDDGVNFWPWTRHNYGAIRSVFPIINEDAGTLDSVNQAKQNYHHNDKLRIAIEFSSGIQTKEEFDIQDVTNQPGWTADQDGLDVATSDIMGAIANFNTASGGSEAEIDGAQTVYNVRLATVGVLTTCVYDNGTAGVGATLTASANGVLGQSSTAGLIDNFTPVAGDLILVKNQQNTIQNGIYFVTDLGSVSDPFVLTRAGFYDETSEVTSSIVFVTSGNTNGGEYFIQTSVDPVIGIDRISYKASNYSDIVTPVVMVDTVSIVNVTGTYANGDDISNPGILATIKGTSNGTLGTINGVLMTVGRRILLTNQTDPSHNGVYFVSNPGLAGGSGAPYVLTRLIGDGSLVYLHREYLVNNSDSTYFGKRYTVTSPTSLANINVGLSFIVFQENIVSSTNKNIATNDLVFTGNSTTDFNGYTATFQDATLDLDGELILGDADYSRIKLNNVQAGKQLELVASSGVFNTMTFVLGTPGDFSQIFTTGVAWKWDKNFRFDTASQANIYVNNGGLGLALNGTNGLNDDIFINDSGHVKLGRIPTYADNAAAITGGLATKTVYQTATGELRIVV